MENIKYEEDVIQERIFIDTDIGSFNLTDLGNAERLVDKYRGRIIFNHTTKRWHIYQDGVWGVDDKKGINEYAKKVIRELYENGNRITDSSKRTELILFSLRCETPQRIDAMLKLAESIDGVGVTETEIDQNPNYLNLKNGTFDLKTMTLNQHNPAHLITKQALVPYNKESRCPIFDEFLNKIFNGDTELIHFVQKALGGSLIGESQLQYVFFCYGIGANGKSTLFEIIKIVLEEYMQIAPMEMLLKKHVGCIPNDIARIKGSRIVLASETPDGRSWDEQKIKNLTGGDTLSARRLYGEYFEFRPTHTLWIHGNYKPIVHGIDEGIWRRLVVIPFDTFIPEKDRIPLSKLLSDMEQEKSGILNWLLEGCSQYKKEGLNIPERIKREILKYRNDSNNVNRFIEECCENDITGRVPLKMLNENYEKWCIENEEFPRGSKDFVRTYERRGYSKSKGTGNVTEIRGIKLLLKNNPP